jgi:hypothetical protein
MASDVKATDTRQLQKSFNQFGVVDRGYFRESECVFKCDCTQITDPSEETKPRQTLRTLFG